MDIALLFKQTFRIIYFIILVIIIVYHKFFNLKNDVLCNDIGKSIKLMYL